MTVLDSIILGIVEGLTEFLPVSSTGHLILVSHLMGLAQTDFLKSFEIAIQLGSILAVVVLFWRMFLDVEVMKRLIIAFIPTGIIGLTLYRYIKDYLIGDPMIVVAALFVGGLVIILIEHFRKGVDTEGDVRLLTYPQAFLVGLFQALAVIPGVSRSGATVMGGLLMGIPRMTILTFSFLLAVPTMVIATGYDLYKSPHIFSEQNIILLATGFLTAFLVAMATIRAAMWFIRKHSFTPFGVYRIVLALLFFLIIL